MKSIIKVLFVGILMLAATIAINAGDVLFQDGGLNVSQDLRVSTNILYVNSASGLVGIGTTGPGLKLTTLGTEGFPATTGTTQTGSLRVAVSTGTNVLDMGVKDGGFAWIQATDKDDLANDYTLLLNPNGGKVGIGTTSPASTLTVIGNFSATGTKAAVINTTQGAIAFYAMESAEVRLYDEGKSALTNGAATVALDQLFAEVIDASNYIVHITPKGNSNGLYVEQQSPASFVVKESNGGVSNIEFNYMISGKRKEFKEVRLYKMTNFDFGGNLTNI